MIDADLADLYGVETKYLKRQIKRNIRRFPKEFMFILTKKEKEEVVTNWHHLKKLKFSYKLPIVFTEHGIAMLASVLNSEQAIQISIQIIKAFIRIRKFLTAHKELAEKIKFLERKYQKHDIEIQAIFDAIQKMIAIEENPQKKIGFLTD